MKLMKDLTFITTDGTELHYTDRGRGELVVFIHGLFMDRHSFEAMADRLARLADCRCITMELRGHGLSHTRAGFTSEQYAVDVEALLDHVGVPCAILAGHSFGAYTILDYLRQYGEKRVRAAVLIDITPKVLSDDEWKLGIMRGEYGLAEWQRDIERIQTDAKDFLAYFIYRASICPPEGGYHAEPPLWAYVPVPFMTGTTEEDRDSLRILWEAFETTDYRGTISEITIPLLIICAVPGSLFKPEASEVMLELAGPTARLVEMGGEGKEALSHHTLMHRNRREIADEIAKFTNALHE
jgi:pimeloyl-ACP methyl ester carboxylesterase